VKELRKIKFRTMILLSLILVVILSLSPVISSLTNDFIIRSTGRISTIAPITAESEIRGVFVHAFSLINPDWDLVAQTCADYGINVIVVEITGNNYARYKSNVIPYSSDELAPALEAAHARGIELWVSMNVMLSAYTGDGVERRVVTSNSDGSNVRRTNWLCPTNPDSRSLLKDIVEEMASNYDIDGFMFDYIRYETREMCFCEHCEAKFKEDTGLADAVFPTDVIEGGKYSHEFVEWRNEPINDLVRDMRQWMLAIKPDLKFSAAAWRWEIGYPTYWRYWIGQDSTYWVKEGWLDWVAPMAYTDSVSTVEKVVDDFNEYQIAGPEGIIPLVPFIDTCVDTVSTPENFRDRVNKLREVGADGWIIWRYGGPGDGQGSNAPDIRNYLSLLDMPDTFALQNIQVSASDTEATITWDTDLPTTSKIEYSTSPLFTASFEYWGAGDFHYWDVDHSVGTVIENGSYVTNHLMTLTTLTPETKYYFYIQSQDSSGIVTTKVLTFTTQD
jgi:uncharacterized lipoprotein YddW (UPF0748 family)